MQNSLSIDNVEGQIWVTVDTIAGTDRVEVIWYDKVGQYNRNVLDSVSDIKNSKFEISYDKEIVDNLSARQLNNFNLDW